MLLLDHSASPALGTRFNSIYLSVYFRTTTCPLHHQRPAASKKVTKKAQDFVLSMPLLALLHEEA
jgi:hypothetical protein